jgi:hypothetical protein
MPGPPQNASDNWTRFTVDLEPENGRHGYVTLSGKNRTTLYAEFLGSKTFELVNKSSLDPDEQAQGYRTMCFAFYSKAPAGDGPGEVWMHSDSASRFVAESRKDIPPLVIVPTRKKN